MQAGSSHKPEHPLPTFDENNGDSLPSSTRTQPPTILFLYHNICHIIVQSFCAELQLGNPYTSIIMSVCPVVPLSTQRKKKTTSEKRVLLLQGVMGFSFHFASLLSLCNEYVLRNTLSGELHLKLEMGAAYLLYLLFHISGCVNRQWNSLFSRLNNWVHRGVSRSLTCFILDAVS